MARRCSITGKKPLSGNNISHAHNKTKKWQKPNVHYKKLYVPELDRSVRVRVSTRALRSISKVGLLAFLRKQGLQLKDVV
ncbi:MAG: 50S ribosomal protein L28 [Spirochaetaceae bacterium]|nr:MAG: 50S ribosomal protein L28 [Spirochaetaceae bacterium]